MITAKVHNQRLYIALICLVLSTSACQKKCQQPPAEKFKTITGQEWRMVETTDSDPNFKNLSKSTFLIMTFDKDFTGKVNKVLNNKLYDTPVRTFEYNVDPEGGLLRLNYIDPAAVADPASGETGGTSTQSTPAKNSVVEYGYDLKRELELTNTANGAYYRFVPYTGIVDPDNQCTF